MNGKSVHYSDLGRRVCSPNSVGWSAPAIFSCFARRFGSRVFAAGRLAGVPARSPLLIWYAFLDVATTVSGASQPCQGQSTLHERRSATELSREGGAARRPPFRLFVPRYELFDDRDRAFVSVDANHHARGNGLRAKGGSGYGR